jgi:Glyoxalase-like domain
MISAALDHLVIVAPTLAAGADFVARAIGVKMMPGGEHPYMGTHNLLLRLGATTYLEVIAINPAATGPGRPRWFGLDRLAAGDGPQLATWVARTSDIERLCVSALPNIGAIETMTRGAFKWRITIPADGEMVHGGLVPSLIQWDSAVHPARDLPDSGCALEALEAFTPAPELLREQLDSVGLGDAVAISAYRGVDTPKLRAHIKTPTGRRLLSS